MPSFRSSRFIMGLLLITGIMLVAGLYMLRLPLRQAEQGQWVGHTREVMGQLDKLSRHLAEWQLAKMGKPVDSGMLADEVGKDIGHLEWLTSDNQKQQLRIPILHTLTTIVAHGSHPAEWDQLRTTIENMQQEEATLLTQRQDAWRMALHHTNLFIIGIALTLYLAICAVYALLTDELERRRAQTLRGQAENFRLGQIVEVQNAIAIQRLDLRATMQLIADRIPLLVRADGGIIEIAEGHEMVYMAASGSAAPHLGMRINMNGSLSGCAVRENKLQICNDAEHDERVDRDACRRIGLRSMVVVPLHHKNNAVGVLKVIASECSAFNKQDIDTLQLLAGLLSATMNDAAVMDNTHAANRALREQKEELQLVNAQLESLASTDGLTGLKNHRTFRERLEDEFNRAKRYQSPLSLILFDVDHFKHYNDNFGHPAGDAVLKTIGSVIKNIARTTDCAARYGGEEFAVILTETSRDGAMVIAERLRLAIAEAAWEILAVTVSVGVASYTPALATPTALLETADKALYTSKKSGRNCVSHAA